MRCGMRSNRAQESGVAGFLSTPAGALVAAASGERTSLVSARLGPHEVLAKIGEGGIVGLLEAK